MSASAPPLRALPLAPDPVASLRATALRGLARMYDPAAARFVFRVHPTAAGIVREGLSARYTAITLIGLAGEEERDVRAVLAGGHASAVCTSLLATLGGTRNLGDAALTLWACRALRHPDWEKALRRLVELSPLEGPRATVELAWTLSALSADAGLPAADLRAAVAARLGGAVAASGLFPHRVGAPARGARAHVTCFADLVYPIHALSRYARLTGDRQALDVAARCAQRLVSLQGQQGQWWWHYDVRSGTVLERYPVYAVHQDAMGPLALFAVEEATGMDFAAPLARALRWLQASPELEGGSLIDERAGFVWRKVARREPHKLARTLQALASRPRAGWRVGALDALLPPRAVDVEDRPYHLGWILYAWPAGPAGRVRGSRVR
jgi:hypothetical protein